MQAWYTPPPKKEKSKAKRVKKRQCWRRKTATSLEVHGVIEKKQALERKGKRRILLVEMFEVSFAILKAAVNQAVNQAAAAPAPAVVAAAAAAAVNHRQRKERCTMK